MHTTQPIRCKYNMSTNHVIHATQPIRCKYRSKIIWYKQLNQSDASTGQPITWCKKTNQSGASTGQQITWYATQPIRCKYRSTNQVMRTTQPIRWKYRSINQVMRTTQPIRCNYRSTKQVLVQSYRGDIPNYGQHQCFFWNFLKSNPGFSIKPYFHWLNILKNYEWTNESTVLMKNAVMG